MTTQTYPYQAWVLMPSFKPAEVTITGPNSTAWTDGYVKSSKEKIFHTNKLFPTKAEAIADGWFRLGNQEAAIALKQANIEKRKEALRKAAP